MAREERGESGIVGERRPEGERVTEGEREMSIV